MGNRHEWSVAIACAAWLACGCNVILGYDAARSATSAGGSAGTGGAAASSGGGGTAGSASSSGAAGQGGLAGGGAGGHGGSGGSAGPIGCDDQYGAASHFVLCSETQTSCLFYVFLDQDSCRNACRDFGGECLGAHHNANPDSCDVITSTDCTTVSGDEICECSLGCGGGPPCEPGKLCVAGSCA
ncbi:MAG: hypothetical protein JRI23_15955 [Deltaproteobacteria bacterium]|jgi:hypothetical protein|nr:hypothetical protein [Deltaproteobacteria bacterium]MBW2533259.1 hypothetical protein [Deltaproteobacteria bacterium]